MTAAPERGATDRYRTLFELAPVAYVITDRDGRVVEANGAAERLLDVPLAYLVGKPLQLYVQPAFTRAFRSFLTQLDDVPHQLDSRVRRRSGVVLDVAVEAVADDAEARFTIQDVSSQRLAEEQLWELNRALEQEVERESGEIMSVLDQLPVSVVTVDGATRTVRRANARAQETLGLGPGSPLDALERLAADGSELPLAARPSTRALAGAKVEAQQLLLRKPSGDTHEIEVAAVPLRGPQGEVTGAVLTVEDVTDRGRRERAERDFVSNAAHQLRSPLAAIASTVAVLGRDEALDPDTRRRFVAHLERETDRMTRLTEGLLTLARVDRDGSRPAPSLVPVRRLLETLAEENEGAGVAIQVDADERAAVVANETLLLEALGNLVANATHHAQASRVILRAARAGGDVVIEIADDGVGMAPEQLERVFDRFYRGESARSSGFGLGLPIARAAARAAGGGLTIDSEPGRGTRARVVLPGATLL